MFVNDFLRLKVAISIEESFYFIINIEGDSMESLEENIDCG